MMIIIKPIKLYVGQENQIQPIIARNDNIALTSYSYIFYKTKNIKRCPRSI